MRKGVRGKVVSYILLSSMMVTSSLGAFTTPSRVNAAQQLPKSAETQSVYGDEIVKLANKKADGKIVTLSSKEMDVRVDLEFPRVLDYKMKSGNDAGKIFYGQSNKLDTITLNGVDVKPKVSSKVSKNKTKITYTITAKDTANKIDAVLTAEMIVKGNTLTFNITKIKANKLVSTIEIKNHSLVSVRSTQKNANLQGAVMSTNTHKSGDSEVIVDKNLDVAAQANKGYMYAFVSNAELSAGLWSNAENKGGTDWQRVSATAEKQGSIKTLGLGSTPWTYQNSKADRKQDGTIEYTKGPNKDGDKAVKADELPSCKIIITGDLNEDKKVDWQDGAIAYRDIMNNPLGAELVPDLVAYRIAMNFGGQAQNPFLMTLDNVKKISLNTDGLGQSILLKGYGSEGHDSGHLNYADIGTRIGGAEEMKILLEKGKEYGAVFGIHVNASETYPESKYFTEPILRKGSDGIYSYGWNWIDQGINIDALYDLRNGRIDRWKDLYDKLGGKDNDLTYIYVDVWGNGQSGDNGTWASRQIAKEIIGHNWVVAGEWGYANEYDSIFQHWAADLTYGGYSLKGINSDITRFIRNHQKDSWVGNYPRYGGEADAPLLGGYNMKDFEGWQGRSNYADYIYTLFEVNLASKFIQHFEVTNWEDGKPVEMTDNGETYQWSPGMKATLKMTDAGNKTHKLNVERKSNDYAKLDDYRTRTMTYDGQKIYEGLEGNTKYLIPWNWDANGNELPAADQKMYHWNTAGGKTTWELPKGWDKNVKVYSLNDLGKQEEVSVAKISNGKITLNAKAKTPYVIHKVTVKNEKMVWSEGMKIVDSGFNSGSLKPWTITGKGAKIQKSQGDNPMLMIKDNTSKTSVSQKITDLKPNTKYAVYVGVDNRSDSKASLTVTGAKSPASNSTLRSIAENFIKAYAHNTNKSTATVDDKSYFQHLYVFFETGAKVNNVKLELSKEAGDGAVYFDDVRIVAGDFHNWPDGNNGVFTQDFETVAQGVYPFVIGNLEGVEDNRTHLAEKHEPYTQRGWNNKKISDVISGNWSLKTNGLVGYDNLVYQTIPQNYTFEPGYSYQIKFDYEAGGDGNYSFVVGSGDYLNKKGSILENHPLMSTIDEAAGHGSYVYTFIPPANGKGWIGIYSNEKAAAIPEGILGKEINFQSFNDFMLDNLVITKSELKKSDLSNAIKEASSKEVRYYTKDSWKQLTDMVKESVDVFHSITVTQSEIDQQTEKLLQATSGLAAHEMTKENLLHLVDEVTAGYNEKEYLPDAWTNYMIEINYAKSVAAQDNPKTALIKDAFHAVVNAEKDLQEYKGTVTPLPADMITNDNFKVSAGSFQPGGGGEGLPEYAVDGDLNTIWHTSWDGAAADKDRWFQFDLLSPTTIHELAYIPRPGAGNGTITKYNIEISKDSAKTWTSIASGDWDKDTKEKVVPFTAQDGVTNVRLTAVTAVGSYGSAAEIILKGKVKAEQPAPSGLTTKDTYNMGRTGAILGTDTTMQYASSIDGTYKDCTGTEIAGLAAGTYYVRKTATDTKKASTPAKVVILGNEPIA